MSDEQVPQSEDYVLVPRRRLKLSRMRRFIIGGLVLGTIAALGGAGTFASFSATTTNDATFKTVRLAMSNKVNGGTACTSPSAIAGTGTINAAIDTNNGSCTELFPDPLKSGTTATAAVEITNTGDTTSDLYLFAPADCTVGAVSTAYNTGSGTHGTNGQLCGRVDFSVSDGTNCLFPSGAGACAALADGTTNQTFHDFFTTAPFTSKLQVATAMATSSAKTFTITVRMKNSTGGNCSAGTDSNNDGFVDSTGIGCDNKYMNEKATLQMRWLMQA